ncbi:head decoration protein [Comamonas testosteroni]|uniref:head decoration protein n=1 Tax=Comamonas testosteroni TaxID=285 RepID=UPI0006B931FE|nr:head decoration protein [Comamonas testosteroni]
MTTLTEGPRNAGYLISEANGTRSREVVTLAAGGVYPPGAVLAQVTASQKFVELDPAASDGSEKAVAVLYAGVDATDGDKPGVISARDTEVHEEALIFPAGITPQQTTTALAELRALGIVAR